MFYLIERSTNGFKNSAHITQVGVIELSNPEDKFLLLKEKLMKIEKKYRAENTEIKIIGIEPVFKPLREFRDGEPYSYEITFVFSEKNQPSKVVMNCYRLRKIQLV